MSTAATAGPGSPGSRSSGSGYRWVVLSNTTIGVLLATVNSSIVIISLPAIFRGIHLDPLTPGNVSYLLWLLMGYILVSAVLVVTLGRLGDMYGRVRIYNAGFALFTVSAIGLTLTPLQGAAGALWLIGFRVIEGIGGAMLLANSTAILTDAFPADQRGMAMGINQVAALAGSFIGLVAGGLLSEWNWRAVFWVSVPISVVGTIWSYRSLRDTGRRVAARIDWWGNITFAVGLTALLAGVTYGIQPYGGHDMGWTSPKVLGALIGGAALLVLFVAVERRVAQPMFNLTLFRNRAFAAGNATILLFAVSRGGMQFMLIIWLQGIWLPLHGYDFIDTPLWAGIYMLPLTVGFLIAGPASGFLSDRFGARAFATGGMLIVAGTFVGLLLPTDFSYPVFALLLLNGVGSGLFSAPNTTAVMNVVPPAARGGASGMRGTFMNSGQVLSIGLFFSLMIAGLAASLPASLRDGLSARGVPADVVNRVAELPPVGSLFAAFLGYNPMQNLLGDDTLSRLPAADAREITGREFFPHLIAGPFHHGLVIAFTMATVMAVIGAFASLLRGTRVIDPDSDAAQTAETLATQTLATQTLATAPNTPVNDVDPASSPPPRESADSTSDAAVST
ncbi:MFS transporter [Candidatus Frankia nodulisporulans]|uniref:MFS transporter n=1 Tax=Candidatus Frankia nodulisporulans TaxID=2060052 RepID=UPI0013D4E8F3|nr:MFS transporter [Candidatus Frankia nodulisporulans]